LLLAACGYNPVFQQNKSIPSDHWNKDSIVSINVPVVDTISYHDIYVDIRNLNSYPYSNLYLFVNVIAPNGDNVTDTIEYRLADDYGTWLGKKSSRIWDCRLPFRAMVKFAQTGLYTFNIKQGMRNDELEGISDVGLTIELAPEK
jgi:gliding motility-associated lipoprotein GldH